MKKNYFFQLLSLMILVGWSFQLAAQMEDLIYREYLEERQARAEYNDNRELVREEPLKENQPIPYQLLTAEQAADLMMDSLALVALYNATDGANWSNVWNLDDPITTWQGVSITDSRVTSLSLSFRNLVGTIPTEIGDLSQLKRIYMDSNDLSGSIPAAVGNLIKIEQLWLYRNNLSGNIPDAIGNLDSIRELLLSDNNLTGSIPAAIGNLINLEQLWLHRNNIQGNIPSSIGNLNRLRDLLLDNNELSGNLPSSLGNLQRLELLHANNNDLSGSIPATIGNLPRLRSLDLNSNLLSGSIPAEMGNLTQVISLSLQENELTGSIPASLGELNSLNRLDFSYNQLTGSIPSELGNLEKVVELNIEFNSLSGTLPANLSNLRQLKTLKLSNNTLGGDLPSELSLLINALTIDLAANEFSGCFPNSYVSLCGVEVVNFSSNPSLPDGGNFTDFCTDGTGACCTTEADLIVESISDFEYDDERIGATVTFRNFGQQPADLSGHTYQIFGSADSYFDSEDVPITVQNLPAITLAPDDFVEVSFSNVAFDIQPHSYLMIVANNDNTLVECAYDNNYRARPIPCSISRPLDSLALVALYNATDGANWTRPWNLNEPLENWDGVRLYGSGDFAGCVSELILSVRNLNGTLPAAFFELSQIEKINIAQNSDLIGSIPVEIGKLTTLTELRLAHGNITGNIPTTIANLSRLRSLVIHNQRMMGSIPAELGNLIELEELVLSFNQHLSGTIPSSLSNLAKLESLELGVNQLQGNIPPELGELSSLTELYLGSNQLTGSIPTEIGNLTRLQNLDIRNNRLTGSIPNSFNLLLNLDNLALQNNDLSGCYPDAPYLCSMGEYNTDNFRGYDLSGNPQLPWQGDYARFCAGEEQIGASCSNFSDRFIQDDCSCCVNPVLVDCSAAITDYPNQESFESLTDWQQDTNDDTDWTLNSGSTSSFDTGPESAFAEEHYYYVEASNFINNTANFISPCFNLANITSPKLSFAYHMYGSSMGSLDVEVSTDGGANWLNSIWSRAGDQGNTWHETEVDLAEYSGQSIAMRFVARVGDSFTSDIAIDAIEVNGTNALPIQLLNFQVAQQTNNIQIHWQATNESNFSHYNIQRSADGQNWQNIGKQAGKSVENYQFTDREVLQKFASNTQIYYRLELVDVDGSVAFSPVRSIKLDVRANEITLQPNPATGRLSIEIAGANVLKRKPLRIINTAGQVVKTVVLAANLEYQKIDLQLHQLPRGWYFVQVPTNDGTVSRRLLLQ